MNDVQLTKLHKKNKLTEKQLYNYYNIIWKWFETWDFSELFPLLTKNCTLEEKIWWILVPNRIICTSKEKIIDFFKHKEKSDYEFHEVVTWIWDRIEAINKMERLFLNIASEQIIRENFRKFRQGWVLTLQQREMLPVKFYEKHEMRLLVNQFFDNIGPHMNKILVKIYWNNHKWLIDLIQIHMGTDYEFQHFNRISNEREKTVKKHIEENLQQPSDLQIKACSLCIKELHEKGEKIFYYMDGQEMTPNIITINKFNKLTHYCVEWYIEWQKKWWEINPRLINLRIKKAEENNANLRLLSVCFKPKSKTNKDKLYLNSKYDFEITPYKIPLLYHKVTKDEK